MSFDVLRHHKPDHNKNINQMTAEEILQEFLFLTSGFADVQEPRKGVHMGLPPELSERKAALRLYIVLAIGAARQLL